MEFSKLRRHLLHGSLFNFPGFEGICSSAGHLDLPSRNGILRTFGGRLCSEDLHSAKKSFLGRILSFESNFCNAGHLDPSRRFLRTFGGGYVWKTYIRQKRSLWENSKFRKHFLLCGSLRPPYVSRL